MLRVIAEPLALFISPFIAYALFVLMFSSSLGKGRAWSPGHVSWLGITGLALTLAGILAFGFGAERPLGKYIPAHIENGVLVPGRIEKDR